MGAASEIRLTRDLFLWCIAVLFLFAFTSLFVQIPGLYGDYGILPAKLVLEEEAHSFSDLISRQPTLLRLLPSIGFDVQTAIDFLCLGGIVLSFVAIVSRDQRNSVVFAVLWMFYLSLFQVGQSFLWFQWDALLLEVGFLTILVAPLNFFGLHDATWHHSHDGITFYLVRWLLFRQTFSSGLIKLTSNTESWWSLTAVKQYYETQVLPTPICWYFHQLPDWIQQLSTVCVLIGQIVGSLMMLSPIRHQRIAAFYSQVILLSVMTLTGNFGFYTLLVLTLCLSLVDDELLNSCWTRHTFKGSSSHAVGSSQTVSEIQTAKTLFVVVSYSLILYGIVQLFGLHIDSSQPFSIQSAINFSRDDLNSVVYVLVPLTASIGAYSLLTETVSASLRAYYNKKFNPSKRLMEFAGCLVFGIVAFGIFSLTLGSHTAIDPNIQSSLPQSLQDLQKWTTKNFQLTSPYLFFRRSVDDDDGRTELILEGSNDMIRGWREYNFRFKPGNVSDRLPIVSPHQPRLDYLMWFAARSHYKQNPWLLNLVYRLLTNEKEVLQLMGENPFPDEPPKYIRASLYKYHFTVSDRSSDRYSDSNWWKRERLGDYLPVVSKDDPSFVRYLQQADIYRTDVDSADENVPWHQQRDWTSLVRSLAGCVRSVLSQGNGSCVCLMLVVTGFLLTLFDPSIAFFSVQPLVDGTIMNGVHGK